MAIQSEKEDVTQSIQEKVESENALEEFQAILKEALHVLHYPEEVFEISKEADAIFRSKYSCSNG